MPAFEYRALSKDGNTRQGVREADSARQLRQQLRDAGLTPIAVDAVTATTSSRRRGPRLSVAEQALQLRQLAGLLAGGVPLAEALQLLADQAESRSVRRVMAGVRAQLLGGQSLADGLRQFPRAFPPIVIASVAAGEQSGRLQAVLEQLADYTESRQAVGRQVWLALLYPALVAVVAIAVAGGLLSFVMPEILSIFAEQNAELPLLTRILLVVSEVLRSLWPLLLLGAAGVIAVLVLALRQTTLRRRLERLWLKLPLLGRLRQRLEGARLARTLAILIGSGVPAVDAIDSAAAVTRSSLLKEHLGIAAQRVREGSDLARALGNTPALPSLLISMIGSGERSGKLASMLNRCADLLDNEARTRVTALVGLLEPLLILAVALLVLLIVLGILQPVLQMNTLLQS